MDLVPSNSKKDWGPCFRTIIKGVIKIKRKWLIPVLIGVIIVGITAYWGYDQYRTREKLEIFLGNKYQQAFYEMVDRIEQLQVLLGKSLVSTSPGKNIVILTDIWSHAGIAQQELTRLPLSAETVSRTAKFLSQAGDYAHVMAKNNAEGRVLTDENRRKLNELRQYAAQISESLHQLENQVFAGKINWVELVRGTGYRIDDKKPEVATDGFNDISEELEKFPTFIYDGPFSDHITSARPKGLKGDNISREEARNRARKAVDFKDNNDIEVSGGTSVNSKIASYNFKIEGDNQGIYSIDISEKGGHLVNMINNRSVESIVIDPGEAVNRAGNYLDSLGYTNMEPTYSEINENVAFISFVYKKDDIIFYPDIINLQVAMDNGQVLAVEALSYLMSHQEREVTRPEITREQVREMVGNTLSILEEIQLAVIPQADLSEVLTYEIRGKIGDETYLIYINSLTGAEEHIIRVIKGQGGTFGVYNPDVILI
jgi:spore germination protein